MNVHDVMQTVVTTVTPHTTVGAAYQMMTMRDARIRHLPVVMEQGTLLGIVIDRDVRRALPSAAPSMAALLVWLFLLLSIIPASSAVFNVPSGDVTALIAAINEANSTPEKDTINLEPGTYTLTMIDNGRVPPPFPMFSEGANGLPLITSRIIISGTAADSTIVERDPAAPAFRLLEVAATGSLTLSRLTLRGGTALGFSFWGGHHAGLGGAVFNGGILAMDHSILTENSAKSAESTTASGGAIFNADTAFISNSSIAGNLVAANRGASGGAILNSGSLTILQSSVTGNAAFAGGAGGGAISNGGPPTVTVTLTIINSTVAGNAAEGPVFGSSGGAIANSRTLTLTNSTVAGNSVSGRSPQGGGIANGGTAKLQNTILALNTAPDGPDCFGPVTSLDHNLIGAPTGCTVTLGTNDLTGDPGIGEFTDDGTPGNGHFPLLETSPAIDAGNNEACLNNPLLATDQIGHARIGVCDIGAIEFSSVLIVGLDVRPGSTQNPVNPRSKGVIPIAILSTGDFDASTVDQATVRFGLSQALPRGKGHVADVNRDGKDDLILHFRTQDSGIQCGDTAASITGQTLDGIMFQASDSISTTGCKGNSGTK